MAASTLKSRIWTTFGPRSFAAAWAFTTWVITYFYHVSENGYGLDDGITFEHVTLHAGGWLGAAAVVVSAALTIAALAIAALARPARD